MFERYTEKARRVIFFARYEASQYGSPFIETEHLLLGVLREGRDFLRDCVPDERKPTLVQSIRRSIEELSSGAAQTSTAVDVPLSNAGKRVLAYASEEAERLESRSIDSEHLVLGMLREEHSAAASILLNHGITLEGARARLRASPTRPYAPVRDFAQVADIAEGHMVFVDTNTNAPIGTIELFEAPQSPRIGEIVWIEHRRFTVINVRYELQRRQSRGSDSTMGIKNIVVLLHPLPQVSAGENTPLSST